MTGIRVLLADDHTIFREGLRNLVDAQADVDVVAETDNGIEAVRLVQELRPDVALMDLSMPECGGIEAIMRIRRLDVPCRCIVLSMHEERTYVRAAIAAGAAGYVPKRSAGSQVLDAIRLVARDRSYVVVALEDGRLTELVPASGDGPSSHVVDLTDREHEVFRLVAHGYTHAEIAERLELSTKTIDTYRRRVAEKLGVRTRADLVRYALETGLLAPTGRSEQ